MWFGSTYFFVSEGAWYRRFLGGKKKKKRQRDKLYHSKPKIKWEDIWNLTKAGSKEQGGERGSESRP